MMRHTHLLCPIVVLLSCYPEDDFEAEDCRSSADCARGEACRAFEGRCVDVRSDSLMGSLTCTVSADPNAPLVFGGSDVTGELDENELSLIVATGCVLGPGDRLDFMMMGVSSRFMALGVPAASSGRSFFAPFDFARDAIALLGPAGGGDTVPASAFVSSGFYELRRRPTAGAPLGIYVEVSLEPPVDIDRVGVPCDRGQPECGAFPFSRSYCATFLRPVCTADCALASDCAPYGGNTCSDGFCFRSCSTNADCQAPLECSTISSGARVCA